MPINLALLSYQDYLLEALHKCLDEFDINLVYSSTLGSEHSEKIKSFSQNVLFMINLKQLWANIL